jgi:hypothetical protein
MADVLHEGANSEADNSGIESAAADAWAPPASRSPEQIALAPPPTPPSTPTDTRPQGTSETRPPSTENSAPQGGDKSGADKSGRDKAQDKPKTEEQWAKEFEQLAKKLADDIKAGKFSPESIKMWQKFFAERAAMPGADVESLRQDLVKLGTMINEIVESDPSNKFRIGQAMLLGKDGTARYYMNIRGPGIDQQADVAAIIAGKDTPTIFKVGSAKLK